MKMNDLPNDNREVKLPNSNTEVEAEIEYTVSNDGTYAIVSKCLNKNAVTTVTIQSTYNGVPVIEIGMLAFENCTSLTSITIPDSVIEIGMFAFYGCTSLTSIIIPPSVTTIGERAFWGCKALASITIPGSSAVRIGADALNCPNLEKIITTQDIQPGDYGVPSTASIWLINDGLRK